MAQIFSIASHRRRKPDMCGVVRSPFRVKHINDSMIMEDLVA